MRGPGGPSRKRSPARLLRARDPAGDRCLAGLGQKRAGPVRVPLGGHVAVKPQRADANEKRPPGLAWEQTYKHRARDALGLADLRHALPFRSNQSGRREHRTSTSLDVARRRGPRVLLDPWRPARPRLGGKRQRSKEDGPARGLDKEYGRWRLGLPDCLGSLVEVRGRRVPATPVTALQQV